MHVQPFAAHWLCDYLDDVRTNIGVSNSSFLPHVDRRQTLFLTGLVDEPLDQFRLRPGVDPWVGDLGGEPALEVAIAAGGRLVSKQQVAQQSFVLVGPTLREDDVKMHGHQGLSGFPPVAEPARHPGLEPGVPERREPFLLNPDDAIQVRGRGHQVDHRLGGQPGHGRAPDVFHLLNPAGQRGPELGYQRRRNAFPARIGVDDKNALNGGQQ